MGEDQVRLAHLEAEVVLLRQHRHRDVQALTVAAALSPVVVDHQKRLESLEKSRDKLAWVIGAVTGISTVIGVVVGKIWK